MAFSPCGRVWAHIFLILTSLFNFTAGTSLSHDISNSTFDYVIVGCGIAGLTVAARLSEISANTVLCLEAGPFYETLIQYPVYIGMQPPLFYEWGITTVPQTQLDGRTRQIPMGKGVGGGSLINGMIWNRGSEEDFDAWANLGNPGWSWQDMLPYFKKSETFTLQTYLDTGEQPDTFDPTVHGYEGPVQVSYPEYLWPQSHNWIDALEEIGISQCLDPNDGRTAGGYFLPSSIHPTNQTRSDARRAYYDPWCDRPNYSLATNSQVLRILFSSGLSETSTQPPYGNITHQEYSGVRHRNRQSQLQATAVEFVTESDGPRQTVFARKEVILAAGAIHTPQLLELSGIGDAQLLRAMNISVVQDLPGVGNNLQDHPMIHLNYSYQNSAVMTPASFLTNASFNLASEHQYLSSKSGPWTAKPSTAVAFPALAQITNSTTRANILLSARLTDPMSHLPLSYFKNGTLNHALFPGYQTQLFHLVNLLSNSSIPAYEILNSNAGGLDISIMHPLSRGSVHITSTDPNLQPAVDPAWLSHPFDFTLMITAMEFNQRILDTAPIQSLQPSYEHIPANATRDQLADLLRRNVGTEFHYACTAAMLPRDLGGVVDANLSVYGVRGLRIVDSSVFPLVPGAHLQAVVYAVAEKAADLIKGV